MDVEGLVGVFTLLIYWRAALCLMASSVFAVLLVQLLPWFNGLQGIAIAAMGLFPGVLLEASAAAKSASATTGTPRAAATETSTSVALLTALVLGAAWGGFSCTSNATILAGFVLFLLAAAGWYWYASSGSSTAVTKRRAIPCIALAAFAYLAAAAILNHAA